MVSSGGGRTGGAETPAGVSAGGATEATRERCVVTRAGGGVNLETARGRAWVDGAPNPPRPESSQTDAVEASEGDESAGGGGSEYWSCGALFRNAWISSSNEGGGGVCSALSAIGSGSRSGSDADVRCGGGDGVTALTASPVCEYCRSAAWNSSAVW